MSDQVRVPVVMLHSVSVGNHPWAKSFLSELYDEFVRKLKWLKRHGYQAIHLQDLYEYMSSGKGLPRKPVVLTFDDGYLDNWVTVYPTLKRYDFKGTIFVNSDFVDPDSGIRANLEDVWRGDINIQEIEELGYLSWDEMRAMEQSGVMDIQSHSKTHTWYFSGEKIIDFHHPGDQNKYPWLTWNARPEKKYKWITTDHESFMPYGYPVFEFGRSLGVRRYIENNEFCQAMAGYVSQQKKGFFDDPRWRRRLLAYADEYRRNHNANGRYETDREYKDRLKAELTESKNILEQNLGKRIDFLCWPGGAYTQEALDAAYETGYCASTVHTGNNRYGDDPRFINRISLSNPVGSDKFPWKYSIFTQRFYLARFNKDPWAVALDKLYRMIKR